MVRIVNCMLSLFFHNKSKSEEKNRLNFSHTLMGIYENLSHSCTYMK